jgi:hypothetical protein
MGGSAGMKRWLKGPNSQGEPVVELTESGGEDEASVPGRRPQRSVMAETLTPEQADQYQVEPGRWLFPGSLS